MWVELELSFDNEEFIGAGFLTIPSFNQNMTLSYPKKYQKLSDDDIVELYVETL